MTNILSSERSFCSRKVKYISPINKNEKSKLPPIKNILMRQCKNKCIASNFRFNSDLSIPNLPQIYKTSAKEKENIEIKHSKNKVRKKINQSMIERKIKINLFDKSRKKENSTQRNLCREKTCFGKKYQIERYSIK